MRQKPPSTDILRAFHRRHQDLQRQVRRIENERAPSSPLYDTTDLPPDGVPGQHAVGFNDQSHRHYADGQWRTGVHLIDDYTFSPSGNSHSFTSIPATFGALELRIQSRSTTTATAGLDLINVTFNDDVTSGHYTYQDQNWAYDETDEGDTHFAFITTIDGAGMWAGRAAGVLSPQKIHIDHYQRAEFKTVHSVGATVTLTGGDALSSPDELHGVWMVTDPVVKITVAMNDGDFVAGSRLRLMGVMESRV